MNRDLKITAVIGAALALSLAVTGLWLLTCARQIEANRAVRAHQAEANRQAFEDLRNDRWKALLHDVQGQVRQKSMSKREKVLRQTLADEPYAQGAFIWEKGKGLVCSLEIPPDLAAKFPADYSWKEKGQTPHPRALQDFDGYLVAWQRLLGNADKAIEVFGILIGKPETLPFDDLENLPFDDPVVIRLTGYVLMCIALLLVVAVVWLLYHAAHKARLDALTKTNFVSLVSHELNTPLTAIIPYADMLRKGRLASEEDRQEAYNVIADESVRLKGLVAELLDFSRLERRTKKYTITDFDAAELVRSVVRLMRGRFPDDPPSVSAEGPLPVHADVDAVKAILINLLDNAAKYAPGAPVEVVAEKGGAGVRVEVRDRGPGLSPEGLHNVFTRFWRADDSATASVDGFGLGLTIARSYARDMGGDLTVAAREGGGTVFTLELKEAGNG